MTRRDGGRKPTRHRSRLLSYLLLYAHASTAPLLADRYIASIARTTCSPTMGVGAHKVRPAEAGVDEGAERLGAEARLVVVFEGEARRQRVVGGVVGAVAARSSSRPDGGLLVVAPRT